MISTENCSTRVPDLAEMMSIESINREYEDIQITFDSLIGNAVNASTVLGKG